MGRPEGSKGYFALVLHAHLPFVRHPHNHNHLEELWLFEAMTDTYLPLIELMDGWARDGVPFRIAMSVTPTLASMLRDPLLKKRYVQHLDRSVALSHREMARHKADPRLYGLARMYRDRFEKARHMFVERLGTDILSAFKRLQGHGLELLASAATHGYLPLLEPQRSAVQAQIRGGIDCFRQVFETDPKGFWLPECAFFPGHDEVLAQEGIRYTVVETHGVLHGIPRPRYGHYAPVYSPAGLAFFPRDPETSKQVWSANEGYPGDFDYREFYRDVGHDLPWEEVAPFLPWGVRADTGLKYFRITGHTNEKDLYDPDRAKAKVKRHADDFVGNLGRQIAHAAAHMDRKPIVVAPYDAELFGHWWFEGPAFLDEVVRQARWNDDLELVSPLEYLERHPANQVVQVSESSWGYKGYHEVWLDESNDWIYRHLHECARRMEDLVDRHQSSDGLVKRALDQAAKELMLAQSSDWAFILKSGTTVQYAERRIREHLSNFLKIESQVESGSIDAHWLASIEETGAPLKHIHSELYVTAFHQLAGARP